MLISAVNFLENIKTAFTTNLAISIIDIVAVAAIFYFLFVFLKKRNSARLIKFIVLLILIATVLSSSALGFPMLGRVFGYSVILVVAVVIIIFPQEIRRSLYKIASPHEMESSFNTNYSCSDEELKETINEIVKAVQNMAKKNVGALIIIAPDTVPIHILESGTELNSLVSSALLECLFNTKANLHDGAVFINGNIIRAAGCFLPLSQNQAIDKELGTRHRAAIGITENYNMFSIIVSEETGVISTARNGEIVRYYDSEMLINDLEEVYGLKAMQGIKKKKTRRLKEKNENRKSKQ